MFCPHISGHPIQNISPGVNRNPNYLQKWRYNMKHLTGDFQNLESSDGTFSFSHSSSGGSINIETNCVCFWNFWRISSTLCLQSLLKPTYPKHKHVAITLAHIVSGKGLSFILGMSPKLRTQKKLPWKWLYNFGRRLRETPCPCQ